MTQPNFCLFAVEMEFVDFIKSPMIDNVKLVRNGVPTVDGTLCITGHHLLLSSRSTQKEELWVQNTNLIQLTFIILNTRY